MGIGEWLSLLGLLVGIVGFFFSIRLILKSKSAAEAAEGAAVEAREGIKATVTVRDLSSAITMMDEIKRLHRMGGIKALATLLERYASLSKLLVAILRTLHQLSDSDRCRMMSAIQQTRELEGQTEEAFDQRQPLPAPKVNEILSKQIESLQAILSESQYNA